MLVQCGIGCTILVKNDVFTTTRSMCTHTHTFTQTYPYTHARAHTHTHTHTHAHTHMKQYVCKCRHAAPLVRGDRLWNQCVTVHEPSARCLLLSFPSHFPFDLCFFLAHTDTTPCCSHTLGCRCTRHQKLYLTRRQNVTACKVAKKLYM